MDRGLIRREETAGTVEVIEGRLRRRAKGRVDYVLRIKVNLEAQPVTHFDDFFARLPGREAGERSWTVERAAIQQKGFDLKLRGLR